MCGRFTLRRPASELIDAFRLLRATAWSPRYNIAPTQQSAVICRTESGRELLTKQWGLVPAWSRDPKMGARLINARAETVATKPSFRDAFRKRRCLVPADGFYEWQQVAKGIKQPYLIGMRDDRPFAFAGLWEHWECDGISLDTFTIITTEANDTLRELHERMPVILRPNDYDAWLDPKAKPHNALEQLLVPYDNDPIRFYQVSTLVNSPRNDTPECIAAMKTPGKLFPDD